MKKYLSLLLIIIFPFHPFAIHCSGNNVGGWEYINIIHYFRHNPRWFIADYFEHHNIQYRQFDCCFNRCAIGYSPTSWLKMAVGYDIMRSNHNWTNRLVPEATGSFAINKVRIAIRERYQYAWCPAMSQDSHELRSRIKAQYHIPQTHFTPYLATELFTTDARWTKLRYYAGANCQVNQHVDIECYYLYHVFRNSDSKHIVGLGINIRI